MNTISIPETAQLYLPTQDGETPQMFYRWNDVQYNDGTKGKSLEYFSSFDIWQGTNENNVSDFSKKLLPVCLLGGKQSTKIALYNFSHKLKENGFTVLVSAKHPFEWLFFEKNGDFGTVGADYFLGYNFGSVHKPCSECGTSFGTDRETSLSIKHAEKALIFAPHWATDKQRRAIKKYKDVQDFINSTHNKWAEYYIF